jgi:hypothetical protein
MINIEIYLFIKKDYLHLKLQNSQKLELNNTKRQNF